MAMYGTLTQMCNFLIQSNNNNNGDAKKLFGLKVFSKQYL